MNVINLEGVCRDDDSGTTTLVLEHLGKGLQWLAHDIPPQQQQQQQQQHRSSRKKSTFKLSMLQIQLFMYKLLVALDYSHSCGVMHRDVKPRNVVIHKQSQQLRLIDWGLGDFYVPGKRYVRRVGSRYYKAPELLVGFSFYDYAIDIFSAGCVLAGLLLQREPFFRGRDNEDQLVRIACVLGTDGLHRFLRRYNVQLSAELLAAVGKHNKKP
eukprot:8738-Heterococcus_DN1.PRE.1